MAGNGSSSNPPSGATCVYAYSAMSAIVYRSATRNGCSARWPSIAFSAALPARSLQLFPVRAVEHVDLASLVLDPQLREQQPHLVAVARDRVVVEEHWGGSCITLWTVSLTATKRPAAPSDRAEPQVGAPPAPPPVAVIRTIAFVVGAA